MDKLTSVMEKIKIRNRTYELSLDKNMRKKMGCYYTSFDLAFVMVEEMLAYIKQTPQKNILEMTFLEPCVGTGNFVFSYLFTICDEIKSTKDFEKVINNIYVADIDHSAITIYKENLMLFANEIFNFKIKEDYFTNNVAYGLLFNLNDEKPKFISLNDAFQVTENYFDIIITNPPYKNLKAEISHYSDESTKEIDKVKYTYIGNQAKSIFNYSNEGTLNIYKFFVEAILEHYSSDKGYCSMLIPSSILSDKYCRQLRERILEIYKILSIKTISEQSDFVDAQQALCALLISKSGLTTNIKVSKNFDILKEGVDININTAIVDEQAKTISILSQTEYELLQNLKKFPTIKELPFIHNFRGELDLTQNKSYVTNLSTEYKLIKGRNISLYKTVDLEDSEYVSSDFLKTTNKLKYINLDRIACQQISNQNKLKRVVFAPIEKKFILGNSCNFMCVDSNAFGIDLYWLMGVLNSSIINWYFKQNSSNNHINNYEIDSFPLPIHQKSKERIKSLVLEYLDSFNEEILTKIDALVNDAYGIHANSDSETKISNEYTELTKKCFSNLLNVFPSVNIAMVKDFIINDNIESILVKEFPKISKFDCTVIKNIVSKYKKISEDRLLNHTTFKLSDLDLEMIKNIPQGGNWKNIAPETIAKSKRLLRITETGGRTTLYGRIDYSKPSYTITTYFNRPGNGTYIHPVHDRVLSVREAARLQSFPDNYFFYGNKTQLLRQVGNAIPPLLAYQIGTKIANHTNCQSSLDLFCGAGGMTCGLKMSGIQSVVATDIEESACITLKINNTETEVVCGDITDAVTKNHIINLSKQKTVDLVCGGPPCQGFSMAGFRNSNDPRNKLFKDFIDIVSEVMPKVIVFENVEGILTFENGKTYSEILALFDELGYCALGQTLFAHHFAVPQKRKRVIIICTRKDLNISPSKLFPDEITKDTEYHITSKDAIYDLQDVLCVENAKYASIFESEYLTWVKSKITAKQFLSNFTKSMKSMTISEANIQLSLF